MNSKIETGDYTENITIFSNFVRQNVIILDPFMKEDVKINNFTISNSTIRRGVYNIEIKYT